MKLGDLYVSTKDIKGNYVRVLGKGRKEREVGLPASTISELMKYTRHYREAAEGEDHIFLGRSGGTTHTKRPVSVDGKTR